MRKQLLWLVLMLAICAWQGTRQGPPAPQITPDPADQLPIEEAIIRHLFPQASSRGLVFLSNHGIDPDSRLLERLQDLKLLRLRSQSNLTDETTPLSGGVRERNTKQPGLLLSISRIQWQTPNSVVVPAGVDDCTGTGGHYAEYLLELEHGSWTVKSARNEIYS